MNTLNLSARNMVVHCYKSYFALAWLLCLCTLGSSTAFAADDIPIGIGDEIIIAVFNEPELTVQTKVGATGTVRMPLLGDVTVIDKTTSQLGREIMVALEDGYLVAPQVSVVIETFRPFYIKGEVTRAGSYEYVIGLTVDQAIAIAGGLKERASTSGWFIVRGPNKTRLAVDKEARVLPGDIIEVTESFF